MNNLSYLIVFFFLINLSLCVECDRYLESGPTVVPATTRTYVIGIVSRDVECEIPINIFLTPDTNTRETLTLRTNKVIKQVKPPEEYSIEIDSVAVFKDYPYCRKYFKDGTDIDYPNGTGTLDDPKNVKLQWLLTENYTRVDNLGITDTEIEHISTYITIQKDTSYQFEVNMDFFESDALETKKAQNYIVSDIQDPDTFITYGTTYDIGDVATYGTFSFSTPKTGMLGGHPYFTVLQQEKKYINYNIFANGTENCWLGYIDTKKYYSSFYADCSSNDGQIKSTDIAIYNRFDINVDICRQLKSTGSAVIKDNIQTSMTVVFDISVDDYSFPTDYYESVKTPATKISFNLYPIDDMCLISVIPPTDDTKTLQCQISNSQFNNKDVLQNFIPSNTYIVILDHPIKWFGSCSSVDISCTTTVVSAININEKIRFDIIDPPNNNFTKVITGFGSNFWELWQSMDSWGQTLKDGIVFFSIFILWWILKKLYRKFFTCLCCLKINACCDTCWLNDMDIEITDKDGELSMFKVSTTSIRLGEQGKLGDDTQIKLENLGKESDMKKLLQENEELKKKVNGNGRSML